MVETKEEKVSFKPFNLKREAGSPCLDDDISDSVKAYNFKGYELAQQVVLGLARGCLVWREL